MSNWHFKPKLFKTNMNSLCYHILKSCVNVSGHHYIETSKHPKCRYIFNEKQYISNFKLNEFLINPKQIRWKFTAIIWSLTLILPSTSATLPSEIPLTNIRGFPSAYRNTTPAEKRTSFTKLIGELRVCTK